MKQIELMIGSNFDPILPQKLAELNEKYADNNIRVAEIFGSIQGLTIFGTARPDFRVPKVSRESFEQSVAELISHNILVNYTDNTPLIDKKNIDIEEVKKTLDYLKSIGIGRITTAHPLSMELIAKYSDIPVEVSTIYQANNAYQIRELKRRCPNINKVCIDVALNRDFEKLVELRTEADKHGIALELLANELCIKDCADRIQCYNEHAQCKTDEDTAKFGRYPMGRCTKIRNVDSPVEWTRAPFILPQSMQYYQDWTDIYKFKVTGRTSTTEYILGLVEMYLSREFTGNLLELWSDVKNIARLAKGKNELLANKYEIDSSYYQNDFIDLYRTGQMDDLDEEYEMLNEILTHSMS